MPSSTSTTSTAKLILKKEVTYQTRSAPRNVEAFRIIANIHRLYDHAGIRKTLGNATNCYYEATKAKKANVKWVVEACTICRLDPPNATEPLITLIVSDRCLDRIQIDLMDSDLRPMASINTSFRLGVISPIICGCAAQSKGVSRRH